MTVWHYVKSGRVLWRTAGMAAVFVGFHALLWGNVWPGAFETVGAVVYLVAYTWLEADTARRTPRSGPGGPLAREATMQAAIPVAGSQKGRHG